MLHQFVGIPNGPVGHQLLAARIERIAVGNPLARQLVRVDVGTAAGGREDAPSSEWLYRFGPQALPREANVPVVDLFAHRNCKRNAQTADKILLLVAIEDDGVDQSHLLLAGVEIKTHDERQPLAL